MSYYQHTDMHGDFVQVELHEDGAWVILNQGRGGAAITLDMAEAQRFTDAVMDAAIAHEDQKQKAEREAEDAKVDEYRRIMLELSGVLPPVWSGLTDDYREKWRNKYRAAREFFAKEDTPAPRVLQHGDPEPDHGTKWRDTDGDTWDYGREPEEFASGWRWTEASGDGLHISFSRPWGQVAEKCFPMTEVTE